MRAVFLDYATVSTDGDLDPGPLLAVLPDLRIHDQTPDALVDERIAGAEVVLLHKIEISRACVAASPALRLVALTATGTNNLDLEAARERGVAVCNIRDYCTPSIVQHVFAVLLSLTHHLREYDRALKPGAWESADQFAQRRYPVRELAGRTRGRGVAGAFGMRVLVANRPGTAPATGRLPLDELLPQVDVLSLHCPITPATRNLIGARQLALMKRDAILINAARGALGDSAALASARRAPRRRGDRRARRRAAGQRAPALAAGSDAAAGHAAHCLGGGRGAPAGARGAGRERGRPPGGRAGGRRGRVV